jgi:hypothetical protein
MRHIAASAGQQLGVVIKKTTMLVGATGVFG